MAPQHEALAVERQPVFNRARVENLDRVGFLAGITRRHAWRRLVIVGIRLFGHRLGKVERDDDAFEIRYRQAVHQTLRPGMGCRDATVEHHGHKSDRYRSAAANGRGA